MEQTLTDLAFPVEWTKHTCEPPDHAEYKAEAQKANLAPLNEGATFTCHCGKTWRLQKESDQDAIAVIFIVICALLSGIGILFLPLLMHKPKWFWADGWGAQRPYLN